jgi:hypothetical protein
MYHGWHSGAPSMSHEYFPRQDWQRFECHWTNWSNRIICTSHGRCFRLLPNTTRTNSVFVRFSVTILSRQTLRMQGFVRGKRTQGSYLFCRTECNLGDCLKDVLSVYLWPNRNKAENDSRTELHFSRNEMSVSTILRPPPVQISPLCNSTVYSFLALSKYLEKCNSCSLILLIRTFSMQFVVIAKWICTKLAVDRIMRTSKPLVTCSANCQV